MKDRQKIIEDARKAGVDMSWLKEAPRDADSSGLLSAIQKQPTFQPRTLESRGEMSPGAAGLLGAIKPTQPYQPRPPGTLTLAEQKAREEASQRIQEGHEELQRWEQAREAGHYHSDFEYGTAPKELFRVGTPGTAPKELFQVGAPGVLTEPKQVGHFHTTEFACPGTREVKVSGELLRRLNALREYLGVPIIVTSGYRTPAYNRQIGGVEGSRHLTGEAADIRAEGVSLQELAKAAEKFFGDGGVGTSYSNHIHVDVGPPRRW